LQVDFAGHDDELQVFKLGLEVGLSCVIANELDGLLGILGG